MEQKKRGERDTGKEHPVGAQKGVREGTSLTEAKNPGATERGPKQLYTQT